MAIRLQDYEGTKRLEEKREEENFWNKWLEALYPDEPRDSEHDIDLCIRDYIGDAVTTEHIPALRRIAEEEKSELNEEDRNYIRGLIKEVEKEYEKWKEAFDVVWEAEKEELDRIHSVLDCTRPAEDQPQELAQAHARITQLEEELQRCAEALEEKKGRKGLLKLSCTQCLDAFAMLLTEAMGVPILKDGEYPQTSDKKKLHPKTKALVSLYSLVTGVSLETCKTYARQRKTDRRAIVTKEKAPGVEATIKQHLGDLGRR